MSTLMALALSETRPTRGYAVCGALDGYTPTYDAADNRTRAVAVRDTDGALVVIETTGAHDDVIGAHNARTATTFERGQQVKRSSDATLTEQERANAKVIAENLAETLGAMTKTRAHAIRPVLRAMSLCEIPTADPTPEPDAE